MITKFNLFENNSNDYRSFRYLDLEKLQNGDLKIILNSDGKHEAYDEGLSYENFEEDFFDDVRCNSEYLYFDDIGEAGFGMTNAIGISYGYYYDDDGELTDLDNEEISDVFIYTQYIIKNFTDELLKNGFVIFQSSMKKTPEEIEEFRLNRTANKYNL